MLFITFFTKRNLARNHYFIITYIISPNWIFRIVRFTLISRNIIKYQNYFIDLLHCTRQKVDFSKRCCSCITIVFFVIFLFFFFFVYPIETNLIAVSTLFFFYFFYFLVFSFLQRFWENLVLNLLTFLSCFHNIILILLYH